MSQQLRKWGAGLALVGIFMLSGIALFQLQVAFGWTNPPGTPPTGNGGIMVDAATGNVGVQSASAPDTLTVGGTINAMGNLIKGVATPVAGTDAVNKDYVLAASSNALTGPLIIYGYGSRNGAIPPDPGTGVAACPNGYSDLLYSYIWDTQTGLRSTSVTTAGGYGPHGIILGAGWPSVPTAYDMDGDEEHPGQVPSISGMTYSICSTENMHVLPSAIPTVTSGPTGITPFFMPACATGNYGGGTGNVTYCNTCRICGKVPTVSP